MGSTVYTESVHFNRTSRETIEDKIQRLIER
ncbi:MAG: transposon-encoded TnpW family protein [Eubacteriaceae bacterium]|nr:transposon-encoded TnpW family protein [Eubacteriaceae bacterium]